MDKAIIENKHYCEVSLGGGIRNEGLEKFLEFGPKKLSFEAVWNDTSFGGELNKYTLNYHLADDSVEV